MSKLNNYLSFLNEKITEGIEIKAKVGVASFKLGMKINQFKGCKPFKKTSTSKQDTLACHNGKVHIFFNSSGSCNQIEAFEGSNISYKGYNFFKKSFKDAIAFLKKEDSSTIIKGDQAVSRKLGIRLWSEDGKKLGSVLVAK